MDTASTPCCTACRAALWDTELAAGRWACERCEHTAFEQLRAMPNLFRRVDTLASLMKGSSPGGIGAPTREAPAPLKLAVLNLTATGGVVTLLQAIEDPWRATLRWSMGAARHHADIDGATRFLTNNLRWACENYADIADDLRVIAKLHRQLSAVDTGTKPERHIRVHCATAECQGRMNITLKTSHRTCPDCDTDYDRDALMRLDSDYGPNTIRQDAAA